MSTVLVTGADGFIGKNLIASLERIKDLEVLKYDITNSVGDLENYISQSDFIFHLAGINRSNSINEIKYGNEGFTAKIIDILIKNGKMIPILLSSSIQAKMENPYGLSKKAGEDEVFAYGEYMNQKVYVYRLPNVFGKWCRPNYNSVVATWCYNMSRNLPIKIDNPDAILHLTYIDYVIKDFIAAYKGQKEIGENGFCNIPITFDIKLGALNEILCNFKESRKTKIMSELSSEFIRCLYSTYISYLPEDNLSYELDMKYDNRGWLAEFIKSETFGQIFISRTKPGVTRGNHYHDRKIEKFLVISGNAVVQLRNTRNKNIIEYTVAGNKLEVLDIPAGYTHCITNIGKEDVITLFWADEIFNPQNPDTYSDPVEV